MDSVGGDSGGGVVRTKNKDPSMKSLMKPPILHQLREKIKPKEPSMKYYQGHEEPKSSKTRHHEGGANEL